MSTLDSGLLSGRMDGIDLRKLAKVLALADSAHTGEANTALRAAGWLLGSGGKTWGDLAQLVLAGGTPPSKARAALRRGRDALRRALAEERARHALALRRLRAEFAAAPRRPRNRPSPA